MKFLSVRKLRELRSNFNKFSGQHGQLRRQFRQPDRLSRRKDTILEGRRDVYATKSGAKPIYNSGDEHDASQCITRKKGETRIYSVTPIFLHSLSNL